MVNTAPDERELRTLLGKSYEAWQTLNQMIEARYEMETLWNKNQKPPNLYEYKYRRGGKTLCALYVREGSFGFMVIFGREEREKFEALRDRFPKELLEVYDRAQTYHDGKWVMFEVTDSSPLDSLVDLLPVKRKPNRK